MNIIKWLKNEIKEHSKSQYIDKVAEDTGWPKKRVREEMKKASEMGFSYRYYAQKKLWKKTPEQLEKHAEFFARKQTAHKEERERDMADIMKESGMSKAELTQKIREAHFNCGASFYDYKVFRMWEMTDDQMKTFYTKGVFDRLYEKYNSNSEEIKKLASKVRFAKEFSGFINRRCFTNGKNLSWEKFLSDISGLDALFAKPTASSKGQGAEIIRFSDFKDEREIFEYISSKKYMIFEELIKQHHDLAKLSDSSVNTVRVVTIVDKGVCHIVFTMLKMGVDNFVDNLTGGGIVADVDPQTGIIRTNGFNKATEEFEKHPVSGTVIKGFQIPLWEELLDMCKAAAMRLADKNIGLVGWDVAIGEDKIYLVEGNSIPGHELPEMPYVRTKHGRVSEILPFLEE